MILLQALVISILIGIIRGGRPTPRFRVPLRWPALPLVCLAAQAVAVRLGSPRSAGFDLPAGILLLSSLALLVMVWANRRVPGMLLLGLGLLLNLVVMLVNGGYMPIAPETLVRIGSPGLAAAPAGTRMMGFKDVVLPYEQTLLWALSDILVLPWPFAPNAFSPGDVLIALGLFVFTQRVLLNPGAGADLCPEAAVTSASPPASLSMGRGR
jgi:hypothetical protein